MSPSHHIKQSRRQLKFATRDTSAGDHYAAARSLARATSHAATAMSVHWDYLGTLRPTRRRLQSLLTDLANHGYASYSLTGVMRAAYDLPDRINDVLTKAGNANAAAAHREIARILRRTRMRARRLLKAILKAMADHPNPPTFDEIMAEAAAPHPAPTHKARPDAPPDAPPPDGNNSRPGKSCPDSTGSAAQTPPAPAASPPYPHPYAPAA